MQKEINNNSSAHDRYVYRDNTTKLKLVVPKSPKFQIYYLIVSLAAKVTLGCSDTPELRNYNDSNGKLASINLLTQVHYYINLLH